MTFSEASLGKYTMLPHSLGLPSTMAPYCFHEHLSVSDKLQALGHFAKHEWHCLMCCRAGDTIVLEAGQMHDAHDVVILWPLKLVGSGNVAEDTLLVCPKGPEAALDFRCCSQS